MKGYTYGSSTCADTASRSSCWSTSDHAATGAPAHCPTPEAPTCASRATTWMRTSRACRRPASSSARCRSRRPADPTGRPRRLRRGSGRQCSGDRAGGRPSGAVNLTDGKVVLTGAAGGLGLVLCRAFADEGLVSCSPTWTERLGAAAAEVPGGTAEIVDVTDAERFAGSWTRRSPRTAVWTCWSRRRPLPGDPGRRRRGRGVGSLHAVNVKGTFLCAQAALRVMTPADRIDRDPRVDLRPGRRRPVVAYATSKAAVIGLTKALARYAGPLASGSTASTPATSRRE